jgi:hypothetical protein
MISHENPDSPTSPAPEVQATEQVPMGTAAQAGLFPSGEAPGPEAPDPTGSPGNWRGRKDPQGDVHSVRSGSPERVWLPEHVDSLEQRVTAAFSSGDPEQAWLLSKELLLALRDSTDQAARDRFKSTFGTPRCLTCTGLHAGPGVVATCYQVKLCFYRNLAEANAPMRLARAMGKLGSGQKK